MKNPTVDEILTGFLATSCFDKQPATCSRYRRVDAQLRRYLEATGHRFLESSKVELLGLEQAYELDGACSRIMIAEDLVHALADFLREPWLLQDGNDRRSQISQTSRLAQWLCSRGLVDAQLDSCALIETRIAVEHARQGYTRDPRSSHGL